MSPCTTRDRTGKSDWGTLPVEEVRRRLGLGDEEAVARLARDGPNVLPPAKPASARFVFVAAEPYRSRVA